METLILTGVLLGLAGGIAVTALFYKNRYSRDTQVQSVILLEKIKHVCKLITVEGEFSEVFSHRDGKSLFFKLLQLEKKALLIIKAKVLVGFDLAKIADEDLPENFRGKSIEEKQALIDQAREEREKTQAEIMRLSRERDAFVAGKRAELANQTGEQTLDQVVISTVREQAVAKGYSFDKGAGAGEAGTGQ